MMVGHGRIDSGHVELIGMVNRCADLLEASAAAEELRRELAGLRKTLAQHVAEEEAIMKELGYADVQGEKDEHREGLAKLSELLEQCQDGANLEMLLRDVTGLLLNIFIKSDMGFKSYLQSINYHEAEAV